MIEHTVRQIPPKRSPEPTLSVIVPCHNEQATVSTLYRRVIEEFEQQDLLTESQIEIIFVDDGSRDDTATVITNFASMNASARALVLSRNFGKEAAMLAGLEASRGKYIGIMDGDLQHPPAILAKMFATLSTSPHAGQVVACRTRDGDALLRKFTARSYYRFVNYFISGITLHDGIGDFRVFTADVREAILSLPERKRFSKGLFEWVGFETTIVYYTNQKRESGESSWSTKALIGYALDSVLSFSIKPLRATFVLGLVVVALSLIYLGVLFVQWILHGVDTSGYLTLIGALTLFSGVQLITLGIIGEYIGAIYEEVKSRPHYVIKTDSRKSE